MKSTDLVSWFKCLSQTLKKGQTVKFHMSPRTLGQYHALTWEGFFDEFLMTREYKSGLVHLVKVR